MHNVIIEQGEALYSRESQQPITNMRLPLPSPDEGGHCRDVSAMVDCTPSY
ncbi:predicted protein [Plenodomus lingam JN3]|uniref:Predicted protein n=1 Tax=Leptosphaeria maculans (strain JN3 / isolate v23.1.3 / race Av1-4-5-6-7-8) TaxID=985895 RepID=E4ZX27_LEPMJ|nr:predicted protein [Plenodomus lingam JN3]CBX95237.1 predicted protein [Plenodomus lingam JN3]